MIKWGENEVSAQYTKLGSIFSLVSFFPTVLSFVIPCLFAMGYNLASCLWQTIVFIFLVIDYPPITHRLKLTDKYEEHGGSYWMYVACVLGAELLVFFSWALLGTERFVG